MNVLHALQDVAEPMAWSLGMFDGVHIGHQALLKRLGAAGAKSAVLTFPEHPLTVLAPSQAPRLLTPLPEKLALLERYGVDVVLVLPFTKAFAAMPFDALLDALRPSHLVLGAGSAFGRARQGTEERVRAWAQPRGVSVEYVEKTLFEGEPVSSSRVRKSVALMESLLGRSWKESHV